VILYPAVDILDGQVVRLTQGDFEASTTYASEPAEAARLWAEAGAQRLHIVDLDGARRGEPVHLDEVREIVEQTGLEIEFGGGLRSLDAIDAALAAGASRVVIGTAAFESDLLERALEAHGVRVTSCNRRLDRDELAGSAGGDRGAAPAWRQQLHLHRR
jgi:phosphoribosylformimino-5-aminoimidazole carboxamide ribotide isomerase